MFSPLSGPKSKSFMLLEFMLAGASSGSSFVLYMITQLPKHHLLKKLSFLQCVFLASLSNLNHLSCSVDLHVSFVPLQLTVLLVKDGVLFPRAQGVIEQETEETTLL